MVDVDDFVVARIKNSQLEVVPSTGGLVRGSIQGGTRPSRCLPERFLRYLPERFLSLHSMPTADRCRRNKIAGAISNEACSPVSVR